MGWESGKVYKKNLIMRQIAVLLTVFNRKDKTLTCLRQLFNQQLVENVKLDVYLVNDGCTDGTPEAVREEFPKVHVINADGNLFWNRGMYTAWDTAAKAKDYDYYLWLNDDTFVYPYMLLMLMKSVEQTDNQSIIIGATQSSDHKKITYGGRIDGNKIPIPDGNLQEVKHFNGNIVLVPKNVYEQLGNLDYYFSHSKGDFDYGLRAFKAGIKMYQAGKILGECEEHPSLDRWCDPTIPFRKRWLMLHRPNGMPPKEIFHLEFRHYGILKASFHFLTIYIRCLLPNLWKGR